LKHFGVKNTTRRGGAMFFKESHPEGRADMRGKEKRKSTTEINEKKKKKALSKKSEILRVQFLDSMRSTDLLQTGTEEKNP